MVRACLSLYSLFRIDLWILECLCWDQIVAEPYVIDRGSDKKPRASNVSHVIINFDMVLFFLLLGICETRIVCTYWSPIVSFFLF